MNSATVRAVLLAGGAYSLAGLLFGTLAGQAASNQGRDAWRWAAWVVSVVTFGAHIVYEQVRLHSSPRITGSHVSLAVGLGAFVLAVAANVHALTVSPPRHSPILAPSLVIWPIMTALPAFVVALVSAMLVARARRSA